MRTNSFQGSDLKFALNSSQFRYNCCKDIQFEPCYILELNDKFNSPGKYVKIMGIIIEIKRKLKYIELTIDDSSSSLRTIFWANKYEFENSKLIGNLYTNPPDLGTLVESRGVVEIYKNQIQLKLFFLNTVIDSNEESLWWFDLYQKRVFIKREFGNILYENTKNEEKAILKSTPLRKKFHDVNETQDQIRIQRKISKFACFCRKCHLNSNIFFSYKFFDDSYFRIISRTIASSFVKFIFTYYGRETDNFEEDFVHFSINCMLVSNNKMAKIFEKIPVSLNHLTQYNCF